MNLRLAATFILLAASFQAQAQVHYGTTYGGITHGYDGSTTYGGYTVGGVKSGGMTVGGMTVGGYSTPGYADQQRQRDQEDEERRRRQREEDDQQLERLRASEQSAQQQRAERDRQTSSETSAEVAQSQVDSSSFDGQAIRKEIVVVVLSGSKTKRIKTYYAFNKKGLIEAGGFAIVPKAPQEAVKVSWGTNTTGATRCYAKHPSSGAVAFNGLPVDANVCKAMYPTLYQVGAAQDGKQYCYEYTAQGQVLNDGLPVNVGNCTVNSTVTSAAADATRTLEPFNDYYAFRSARVCIKTANQKAVVPILDLPADRCPSLTLSGATYKWIDALPPTKQDVALYQQMKWPLKVTVCALVDHDLQIPIAMQFDSSKCAAPTK